MLFNGKSEKDLGLILLEKQIQAPSQKKIKEEVPFMNGSYDFSTVGTNGEITYTDRKISCRFAVLANTKEKLHRIYSDCLAWLMDSGKKELQFDDIPGYYFLAECEDAPSWKEIASTGELSITFVCDPFKYGNSLIGKEPWDTFRFETDYLQKTSFNVFGSTAIEIINPGRIISPIVTCDSNFSVTVNQTTTSFPSGVNKNYRLKLLPGKNQIIISGTGNIEFIFRKELL